MTSKDKLRNGNFSDGYATTHQLNGIGLKNYEISRLCESNQLDRLRQGVYRVKSVKTLNKEKLIMELFPKAVFCFDYPLVYCVEGRVRPPSKIHIAVPRSISRSRCRKIKGIDLIIHYVSENLHEQDVVNGENIKYYDYERTICDIFRYHSHIKSSRWLDDVIRNYIKLRPCNSDKLKKCAAKFRFDKETKELMEDFLWPRVRLYDKKHKTQSKQ